MCACVCERDVYNTGRQRGSVSAREREREGSIRHEEEWKRGSECVSERHGDGREGVSV
jgi:hypothetical protein